jgi:zinc protease
MIKFDKFVLDNGLKVIVHPDYNSSMVAFNLLYNVGARNESADKTGFAHLFEHLMFGGSKNIPSYDEPLQLAGGENNAYTTNDVTNYYLTVPKANIETAFWLESDRLLELDFNPQSLETQRKVVCEEFKEHYINKPYGDVWKLLRQLAYKVHPYQWQTIGKELKHIEEATLEDVKSFFFHHYAPNNAILCVAGPVTTEEVKRLTVKWFGDIPQRAIAAPQWAQEPKQTEPRSLTVNANVPSNALYKAWHMPHRLHPHYYACDLITEILGNGYSSTLYLLFVKEKEWFTTISCYHTGSIDSGLIIVEGKLRDGIDPEMANEAIEQCIADLSKSLIADNLLEKAKNKVKSMMAFEDLNLLNRANSLAFYELLGDANLINTEWNAYKAVTKETIQEVAKAYLQPSNCSTLFYLKKTAN